MPDIEDIRRRLATATPGPWLWTGSISSHQIVLVSNGLPMAPYVMQFARWGMSSAQPRFRDPVADAMEPARRYLITPQAHNPWFVRGIDHPDAALIASAPTDIRVLLDRCDELEAENVRLRALVRTSSHA